MSSPAHQNWAEEDFIPSTYNTCLSNMSGALDVPLGDGSLLSITGDSALVTDLNGDRDQNNENDILDLDSDSWLTCGQKTQTVPSLNENKVNYFNSLMDMDSELGGLDYSVQGDLGERDGTELLPSNSTKENFPLSSKQRYHQNSTQNHNDKSNTLLPRINVNPVQNSTLQSSKGRVIIIDIGQEFSLLNNPFKINRILVHPLSPFKEIATSGDIRINKKKGLIVIESNKELDLEMRNKLCNIHTLDSFPVKCYQPNTDIFSYGVISPVDLDIDLSDLKDSISSSPNNDVFKLERLKRKVNGKLEDSLSIKITFKSTVIPKDIKIYSLSFKVRPFIPPPVQCFNCQRYGHTASSCKSKTRCLICSENHHKSKCETEILKCANCNETHVANSKECQFMKVAREVETVKIKENLSYTLARDLVSGKGKGTEALTRSKFATSSPDKYQLNNDNILKPSYRDVMLRRHRYVPPLQIEEHNYRYNNANKTFATVSTQTEKTMKIAETENANNEDFFKKLRNFMVEILSINFSQENKKSKQGLADSAIRNHFGIDLTKESDNTISGTSGKRKITPNVSSDDLEVLSSNDNECSSSPIITTHQCAKSGSKHKKKKKKGQNKDDIDVNDLSQKKQI